MEQANGSHRGAIGSEGDKEPTGEGPAPPDMEAAQAASPGGGAAPAQPPASDADDADGEGARGGAPERAARLQARQQTLLDWLGHELRNPIAAMDLAIHSMRQLRDERLDHSLGVLERQSVQLGRVVLELLEMARTVAQPAGIGVPVRYLPRTDDPAALPVEQRVPALAGDVETDAMARGTGPRQRLASGSEQGRRRLLLVEDNEDLSDLLRELLTAWGFDVVVAGTALAALAKAAVRPPDVALVDIGLPDRDGCEVARALRNSLPPEIRLIAMSGYGQRHDGARALAAGFDEFLVKPLNTVRLRRLLGEAGPLSLTATSRDK